MFCFFILGRYDLHLPNLLCRLCLAHWTPDMSDLRRSGYWAASVNADMLFSVDVFSTFEEMKTVAPGLSRQGFLRMLERRTCLFGRVRSVWIKVEMVENISVAISFNSLLITCTGWENTWRHISKKLHGIHILPVPV